MKQIKRQNKKAALEMSISTVVVLVIGMAMLILGLVLVRSIFSGAKYNVDKINSGVEAEINKLFDAESGNDVILYLQNQEAQVKKGQRFGVAFGIKNSVRGESDASKFTYEFKSTSVQQGCAGLDTTKADTYLILGNSGSVDLLPGAKPYFDTVTIFPPDTAPLCEVKYKIEVKRNGTPYAAVPFTIIIQ